MPRHRRPTDRTALVQAALCALLATAVAVGLSHAGQVDTRCYGDSTVAIWGC